METEKSEMRWFGGKGRVPRGNLRVQRGIKQSFPLEVLRSIVNSWHTVFLHSTYHRDPDLGQMLHATLKATSSP